MRKSARAFVVLATLIGGSTVGCFAVFGLDGYGPPAVEEADAAADVRDVSVPEARADAPVDAGPPGRIVFVSSGRFTGALGGLDGADERCQESAERAGISGRTFKAWLSEGAASPSTRFARFGADAGPELVLPDGTLVAEDYAELAESGPRVPILLTEQRKSVDAGTSGWGPSCAGDGRVWSNTQPNGTGRGTVSCSGWSSVDATGRVGALGATENSSWTDDCSFACSNQAHLYCFEQ